MGDVVDIDGEKRERLMPEVIFAWVDGGRGASWEDLMGNGWPSGAEDAGVYYRADVYKEAQREIGELEGRVWALQEEVIRLRSAVECGYEGGV